MTENADNAAGKVPVSVKLTPGEPRVAQFTYEGDDYRLAGDVSRGPRGLVVTRVEVIASSPSGVTARALRSATASDMLAAIRAEVTRQALEESGPLHNPEPAPATDQQGAKRTEMTAELLRSVAIAYIEESEVGTGRGLLNRMSERFGRPEGTVRTWVSRARKDGWLGPGARGRAGAEPGPKLLAARLADQLGLGPHPEDEPPSEKMARDIQRTQALNEAVSKWEELKKART